MSRLKEHFEYHFNTYMWSLIVALVFLHFAFLLLTGGYAPIYIHADSMMYYHYIQEILNGQYQYLHVGAQLTGGTVARVPSLLYHEYLLLGYFLTHSMLGSKIIMVLLFFFPLIYTYKFLQKLMPQDKFGIFIITLLFGLNFCQLVFTTTNWNSNFVGVLIPIMVYYLHEWTVEKKEVSLIKLSWLHCVLVQFHILGYFLMPFYIIYLLWYREFPSFKTVLYVAIPWALFFGIYLGVDGYFYDFQEVRYIADFLKVKSEAQNTLLSIPYYGLIYLLFSPIFIIYWGDFFRMKYLNDIFPSHTGKYPYMPWFLFFNTALTVVMIAWSLMAGGFMVIRALLKNKMRDIVKHPYFLMGLWIFIPILIFAVTNRAYNPRYAQFLLPFNFIFLYIIIFQLFKHRLFKAVGYAYLTVHLLTYVFITCFFYEKLNQVQYPLATDRNLKQLETVSLKLMSESQKQPYVVFEPKYRNMYVFSGLQNLLMDMYIMRVSALKNKWDVEFYILIDPRSTFYQEHSDVFNETNNIQNISHFQLFRLPSNMIAQYYQGMEEELRDRIETRVQNLL